MQRDLFSSVIAEVQITYSHKVKPSEQIKITGSSDIYNHVRFNWPDIDYVESFAVLLLSRGMKILGLKYISKGGTSGTVVDAKIFFQTALLAHSSSIALVHNHPSGQLIPSAADLKITKKLKDGGEFLDITVVDHLIISSEGYYSMADEGVL